jgi:hypothetical protein
MESRGASDQVRAETTFCLVEAEDKSSERKSEPHCFDTERWLLLEQAVKKGVPQRPPPIAFRVASAHTRASPDRRTDRPELVSPGGSPGSARRARLRRRLRGERRPRRRPLLPVGPRPQRARTMSRLPECPCCRSTRRLKAVFDLPPWQRCFLAHRSRMKARARAAAISSTPLWICERHTDDASIDSA